METKHCSNPSCEQENPQPLDNFYIYKKAKDGRQRWCKDCFRIYRKSEKRRETLKRYNSSEKRHAVSRRYHNTPKGKATRKKSKKKYESTDKGRFMRCKHAELHRARHPQKIRARYAIRDAIASGKLPRAKTQTCTICGKPAEAWHHHLGYSEEHKFDVVAVCVPCHNHIHSPASSRSENTNESTQPMRNLPEKGASTVSHPVPNQLL